MSVRIGAAVLVGGVTLALAALPARRAEAQRPQATPGRFEVPGMDWAPQSAWRRRAAVVRGNRAALYRRRELRDLNAGGPQLTRATGQGTPANAVAVTGAFHVPVMLIAYSDVPVAFPTQAFQDLLFAAPPVNGRAYSLKTFYEEMSRGRITMSGRVFDPVTTDTTAEYYQQDCNGIGIVRPCPDDGRFGLMLLAVLDSISKRADSTTVWAQYDNDGPDGQPNSGDDDGEVDFVTFLQPVKDGACSGSKGVWAHRWVISVHNNGSAYVTRTPRTGFPGQYLRINNYTMQSQVGGGSGCDAPDPPQAPSPNQIMPIGTVAHETGHAFGLPDLYDTDATSGTEGIGEWGLMGSGNYARAYSPSGFEAWSLNELGWLTVEPLTTSRVVTTGARQLTDTVFVVTTPNPDELFLIENRQAVGSDTAMLRSNVTVPPGTVCQSNCRKQPGLLVWHVDLGLVDARRPFNRINTGPVQGVELVQADGLNQLRSVGAARNRGDDGDPFPGSSGATALRLLSHPAARLHTGDYAGFILDQIEEVDLSGTIRFRFLRRHPTVVQSSLTGIPIWVGGALFTRFEEVVPQGDPLTISADQVRTTPTGKSRGVFMDWSNGGPRAQTVTSGAVPDTLTARYAAEHRVLLTVIGTGQGQVTGSLNGDLLAGFFLGEGTGITLTATPAEGAVFAGWRGDTTAANPVLTLPMERPYDVEASFAAAVAVEVGDATTEILGSAKLTVEQKTYLDLLGNRNGVFDLGDYLALLRRTGQAAPQAIVRRTEDR